MLDRRQEDRSALSGSAVRRRTWFLLAVLLVALSLRLGAAVFSPNLYFPDEIYQTREPAHRLAYGYGVVTWEYRDGARSLVFPGFLAAVMRGTDWMGSGSRGYLLGIDIVLSLLSLSVVWFGFAWGYLSGREGAAIVSTLACATWYEFIYFGSKGFNEIVAGDILLAGIYLAGKEVRCRSESRWWLLLTGVICGVVVALRVHLAPAVLVIAIYCCWKNWRRAVVPLAVGLAIPVLAAGFLDALTWSYPFQSYLVNFSYNVIQERSNAKPWYALIESLFLRTGPLPLLAAYGARRDQFLGAVALAILIPHSIIHHKEYRYIYPMLPLLVVLAAMGLTELAQGWNAKRKTPWPSPRVVAACVALFLVLSGTIASRFPFWHADAGNLVAFENLGRDPMLCGVAIPDGLWSYSGGYTYLHKNVPVFLIGDTPTLSSSGNTFDAIVWPNRLAEVPAAFTLRGCWRDACVYRRSGSCSAGNGEFEINGALRRTGR